MESGKLYRRKTLKGATPNASLFDVCSICFFVLLSLSIMYPFWHLLVISLSTPKYAGSLGFKFWPDALNVNAYREVLSQSIVVTAYGNSMFRTLVGTALTVLVTSAGAYSLSRRRMPLRAACTAFIVLTMFFSGGLIPTYLLIKRLGLLNTRSVLIFPILVNAFHLIIVRNFMMGVPDSLEESAFIDGAGDFLILTRIYLPLSLPAIATLTLWTAVIHWNSWFDALIYAQQKHLMVLQLLLRRIIIENQTDSVYDQMLYARDAARPYTENTLKAATLFVAIGPIVAVYPFIQKYFVKGVMIGSLKG
jgi:putative aldouronate transport system permease protein